MNYLRAIGGAMKWTLGAAWLWAACCGLALALPPGPAQPEAADSSSNYALPYALVVLGILLGLVAVLRSTARRERETPEEYQSKDMLKAD
jgi:hypothetical protein